jgi:hypothetical protein
VWDDIFPQLKLPFSSLLSSILDLFRIFLFHFFDGDWRREQRFECGESDFGLRKRGMPVLQLQVSAVDTWSWCNHKQTISFMKTQNAVYVFS